MTKATFRLAMLILLALGSGQLLLPATKVQAEPWLGNRFAQNCAGCHAPGRKNFADASKRRCTLACQGCHVSPSGSGLRSQYGKWTEDRWLNSFRVEALANKKAPAAYPKQPYAVNQHLITKAAPGEETPTGKKKRKKDREKDAAESEAPEAEKKPEKPGKGGKGTRNLYVKYGAPMKETDQVDPDEAVYDRRDRLEFVMLPNEQKPEFLFQIPMEDPYREMDRNKIDAGVDVRWQTQRGEFKRTSEAGKQDGKIWQSFLMNADIGVRWRPIYRKINLVWEGRYFGQPGAKKLPEEPGSIFIRRSLYLLVDDLPYATYVQGGYYRPIFGNPHPDHTLLAQRMMSYALHDSPNAYDLTYQAISFGGSPNVPYANFHLIGDKIDLAGKDETNTGYAFNGGGRFVSFGASVNFSWWRTKRQVVAETSGQNVEARTEMSHIGLGGTLGRTTITVDGISIVKDVPQVGYFSGGVWQLETYTRIWREMYATAGYHFANTAEDLNPGRASQIRLGAKTFLLPGVEWSGGIRRETYETDKVDERTKDSGYTLNTFVTQLHVYM